MELKVVEAVRTKPRLIMFPSWTHWCCWLGEIHCGKCQRCRGPNTLPSAFYQALGKGGHSALPSTQ